jgi:GDPmannose 4,6-dehydratase
MESSTKVAFITGVSGQDGSYLAEFLLSKNYIVHGLIRNTTGIVLQNLLKSLSKDKEERLKLHLGDICDGCLINRLISKIKPDEIYNLAGQVK